MAPSGLTAGDIADLTGGHLIGDPSATVHGAASLAEAGPEDVTFLASGAHAAAARTSRAAVLLVAPGLQDAAGPATRIVVPDPRAAILGIAERLAPPDAPAWGIHPTARLGPGVTWQGRIAVGPHAVLERGVRLGAGCRVGASAVVGAGAHVGDECRIAHHAFVGPGTVLGARTILHPGARVGTEGFAWITDGAARRRVPHRGACRIGTDVDIGANTTVDRGSLGATEIGDGTKIDNLVHVAHNVRVGARCVILAQTGIAGTTIVGDDVAIGGQAGLAGQLRIGSRARLAAQSGVIGDIAAGATVSGYPARDHRAVLRQSAALARLTPLVTTLERIARDADTD